ncbi:MAG TPA: flavin reductase family protein [Tepidiformaceae bacterium]|nr:flavin reductase family protein [Tepidiformaceae bacterium]
MTHPDLPQMPGMPKELEGPEKAMLALSYGVHVIGSRSASGELNAMLADWVMQVSFRPRLVLVAIENDARTLRFIRETGAFVVNLLHQKDGVEIARKVVMPSEAKKVKGRPEEMQSLVVDKLAGIDYELHECGCPILLQSLGWFSCDAEQFIPTGDHTLVIGRVTDGDILRAGEMLIERDLGWEYAG